MKIKKVQSICLRVGAPQCRKRFVDASQQAVNWKLAHGEIIYSW